MRPAALRRVESAARRVAERKMIDRVRVVREGAQVYAGKAEISVNGRETLTPSSGGIVRNLRAELRLPITAPGIEPGDSVSITQSRWPGAIDRQGFALYAEPVDTWAAYARIMVNFSGYGSG